MLKRFLGAIENKFFTAETSTLNEGYGGYFKSAAVSTKPPAGAAEYLRSDNPRLIELKKRYKGHPAIQHSVWTDMYLHRELNLSSFRADNAYIWQTRRVGTDPAVQYLLTTYYAKEIDKLGLLNRLEEDGQFGAVTFNFNDQFTVSRDLLDSILEINFLERQLRISQMPSLTLLDIGAGYGRLAHRLACALPNLKTAFCTDAVAESSFLCDYYLNFRGVADRAKAIAIDEVEATLSQNSVDIVTNIESFAECPVASITWWLDLIQKYRAKYLMIIVEGTALLSLEPDGSRIDFQPLIEARGFELMTVEPIYGSATSLSKYGLYPNRPYFLFRNRSAS
jgi:hypothetical protein